MKIIIVILVLLIIQPIARISFWLDDCYASPLKASLVSEYYQNKIVFTCENGNQMNIALNF